MVARQSGPGRWLYLLALVIFVVGVVVALILVFVSIRHFTNLSRSFTRVVAPGTSTVQLSKTGTYTIFYEYQSQIDGQIYSTGETPPSLSVAIRSVDTGEPIAVRSSGNSSYSIGSRSGVAVLNFNITNPGLYEFNAQYANGTTGPDIVLAIGHGFAKDLVGGIASILGGMGVFCGATVVTIVITIVVFVLRQRRSQSSFGPPPAPENLPVS